MKRGALWLGLVGCVALGCEQEGVRSYTVPAAPDGVERLAAAQPEVDPHAGHNHPPGQHPTGEAPMGGAHGHGGHGHGAGGPEEVVWSLPAGWSEGPGGQQMRFATLLAGSGEGQLEVTITRFPGDVGGEVANVNRWRGQLGLPAVGPQVLDQALRGVEGAQVPMKVMDARSEDGDRRMVAAMIPRPGFTWFVKMDGLEQHVSAQAEAFEVFLRSLAFSAPPSPTQPQGSGGGAMTPGSLPASGVAGAGVEPEGWESMVAQPPRVLAYRLTHEGSAAEVTVMRFPGDAGGPLANVNRWRGQVGLGGVPSVDAQPAAEVRVGGVPGRLVDLEGPQQRMLAVWVPVGGGTWFVKLLGDKALVEAHAERFRQFVAGLRLGEEG